MNQLISNVLMQPKLDATEPLTLVEKLEQEIESLENSFEQFAIVDDEITMVHTATIAGLKMAINIVKQHSQEICNWRNNKDTDGWYEWSDCGDYSSDCGLDWNMSNDDSPLENDMNFCPKCGRKIVEIQPPSEVQDD